MFILTTWFLILKIVAIVKQNQLWRNFTIYQQFVTKIIDKYVFSQPSHNVQTRTRSS